MEDNGGKQTDCKKRDGGERERKNKEIHGLRDYWGNDTVQNSWAVLLLILTPSPTG
jgi:hypothetical protein